MTTLIESKKFNRFLSEASVTELVALKDKSFTAMSAANKMIATLSDKLRMAMDERSRTEISTRLEASKNAKNEIAYMIRRLTREIESSSEFVQYTAPLAHVTSAQVLSEDFIWSNR